MCQQTTNQQKLPTKTKQDKKEKRPNCQTVGEAVRKTRNVFGVCILACLSSKMEAMLCQVQFSVALINLAVLNYPCFSSKIA